MTLDRASTGAPRRPSPCLLPSILHPRSFSLGRSPRPRLAALLAGTLLLALSSTAAEALYQNPVLPGDHPDPSIIRVGADFWATATSSEWAPQFPLLHSKDLVNWDLAGSVFPHRPSWAVANFWAPEISEYKGHYFVYYVGRKQDGPLAVAVATADNPAGPYTDHGPLIAQEDGCIDPVPVTDENGVRYLVWKEDGNSQNRPTPIWAQPLSEDGTRLIGAPTQLIRNDAFWEGKLVEGPYILRHDGWFYLFYSGSGCCGANCDYALGVARSRTLLGPWEKNPANPILAGNATWKCPGHGSIVADASGRYWLLYHAYSNTGSIFTGREGMLDEVKFGADGWPTINGGKGPSVQAPAPLGVAQHKTDNCFAETFSASVLDPGWQWPQHREPVHNLQQGHLVLRAEGRSTNLLAAVLARPTTAADYVATARVETKPLKPGWLAGLCAFGDEHNAMGVAVSKDSILAWRRDRGSYHVLARQGALAGDTLQLRLVARQGYQLQLSVSSDGTHWVNLGDKTETKGLPPWDRGVRVALTAGGTVGAEACFDAFSIQPLAPAQKN